MPSEFLRPAVLAALRAVALATWLGGGAGTVAAVYPWVSHSRQRWLKQRWSRGLMSILGIRVDTASETPTGGLVVANHVSWVDVFAINAVLPAGFVAKDEVRGWPLIGWLCAHTETLFIRRGSARQAHALTRAMRLRLVSGATLAVFPEGTSTTGDTVLPFMPALFEGAVEARAVVCPVALVYRCGPGRTAATSYAGTTGLLESIWRILRMRRLSVHLDWLPPIDAAAHDRRRLATLSQECIHATVSRLQPAVGEVTAETGGAHTGGAGDELREKAAA